MIADISGYDYDIDDCDMSLDFCRSQLASRYAVKKCIEARVEKTQQWKR
jgi:hypothetical protein